MDSDEIDLDAVLLIFVNGVLQKPGESYFFNEGGTTFIFKEAPTAETFPGANDNDKVDIFFYKGEEGVDVDIVDIQESIKIGDELRVMKSPLTNTVGLTTTQQNERLVKEILNANTLETDIYSGRGVDETNKKPIRWTKQKTDIRVGNEVISKARPSIEPQIYPTAKIIGNVTSSSGIGADVSDGIFVDNANSFFYEKGNHIEAQRHVEPLSALKYDLTINQVDALLTSGVINVGASATAIVSAAGTISIDVTNVGSGYLSAPSISIRPPIGSGTTIGIGSTAFATTTITNGSISDTPLTAVGFGYNQSNPPEVIIELPPFQTDKITSISNVQGFSGIITGITTTLNGGQTALKFFFRAEKAGTNTNDLAVGYPILISDTRVGNGVISVDTHNSSIVGIGTTFLDNIYIVHARNTQGNENGEIICNVQNGSNIGGISTTGFYNVTTVGLTTSLGRLSWGRIYNASRSSSPVSIGVTGLSVNAGLTTFPTIQRKHYSTSSLKGLRSSGSIRVFGL